MATGTTGRTTAVATQPRKHEQVLPARPDQVRVARAFLAATLAGCPAADDAILCASELASNSILHSDSKKPGGTFTIYPKCMTITSGSKLRTTAAHGTITPTPTAARTASTSSAHSRLIRA